MQERRSTIRFPQGLRAHYCPAADLLPRDGRLRDLSERGAGLLARSRLDPGEQISVSLQLAGEPEPWTATGTVRWSGERSTRWQGVPLGLEWAPLEATTSERLARYLDRCRGATGPEAGSFAARSARRASWARLAPMLLAGFALTWLASLHRENAQLERQIAQRESAIQVLAAGRTDMEEELGLARSTLEQTAQHVTQLDEQARLLDRETRRLGEGIQEIEQLYTSSQEERSRLMQRVLELEQERLNLEQRSVPLDELRRAIRDAIEARARVPKRLFLRSLPTQPALPPAHMGNRGYVILDGRPTLGQSSMQIRVRKPELSP